MRIFFHFAVRCSRLVQRLWAALFTAFAGATSSSHGFRGPDILEVGADGSIRVSTPEGPAPLRPKTVVNANFTNLRTQRLARRAAAFLFDYYDFGAVPGQFWPILEKTFDPGQAMNAFLRAIGCNAQLVRRRDPEEQRKAREIIELLVRSGNFLHRLHPDLRRIVGLQLESGHYEHIRELAEVAAQLQAALDFASAWTGKTVVASFAALLRTIQRMLHNPMSVAAADAAAAVSLVAQFSETQRRFDALTERYKSLIVALRETWPEAWRGTPQEIDLRQRTGDFERVAESMQASAELTLDNLTEGNEFLASSISALEGLLEAARAGDAASHKRSGARRRKAVPPDEKEVALRYFGFSSRAPPRSKQELRDAWKKRIKALHPDAHPGASAEEIARLTEQCQECDKHFRILLAYFSWR
jgi:hypothetical protein